MSNFEIWKRMMMYMRPYGKWATIALVGILGGIGLQIAIPTILKDVIDVGIARKDSSYMLAAGTLIIGLGIIRGLMGYFAKFYGERLSHHAAYDVRNEVYDKVQHLSFSYHNQAHTGTLITRAISDVDELQRYFAFGLIDGLTTLALTLGVAIVMFAESPLLAFIALAPMIPLAFLSKNFAMSVEPRWKKMMERIQKLSDHLQENVLGAQVVRAFAREKHEKKRFSDQNEILYNETLDLVNQWSWYIPFSQFIVATSLALVLFFGGLMERDGFGGVTVGLVVSFNAYILLISQPLRFLGFVILLTTQAVTSSRRVFEIIDTPMDIESKADARPMPTIKGHVRMENVDFSYDDAPDMPILNNINLEVEPGQIVALLGKTGSGKSSLVNLLPRFYDVTAGSVTIDDVDVRDVDLVSLRKQIGMVLQDSLLFSATIGENIAYGNPDATREKITEVAKAANAHDFIMEFPDQYDTEIGERGVTLSGGQRQRVAIARALLIDPRILILDDSTSSVDTKTEFLIQEALDRLIGGRTTFVIAQRLTTVQNANQILVLDHGEIAERGTHQELLDMDGLYAEIYRLQLEDQERLKNELLALGGLFEAKRDKKPAHDNGKSSDIRDDDKRSTKEIRMGVPSGGD